MTWIEQDILYSLRYNGYGGKKRFGNTRIMCVAYGCKTFYVKVKGEEYLIAARFRDKFFYHDPFEGKSKLVNSRLALLRAQFLMQETTAEILKTMVSVCNCDVKYLNETFFVTKSGNNRTRYFRTMNGAVNFCGSPDKVWSPVFDPH